jgi:16S rRNA (uracil1498-N3)-methyltransferase
MPLAEGLRVDLPEGAARHAVKALRLRVGDSLVLFDGVAGEHAAKIVSIERERVAAEVLAWRDRECESPLSLTLIQALQSGEKMDMTVQKAVELGVRHIVPLISRRSVVRLDGERALRRVEHWRGVVASACEQCGRNRVPAVEELDGLERWLAKAPSEGVLRLMLAPAARHTLATLPQPLPGGRIELLIGAEGGLAPEEMQAAIQAGFVGIRLGPRILRTETAGLAALAAMQCLWGDFREEVDHV